MAAPTDPTFGADFDADLFRDSIRQTMIMAKPNAVEERLTFVWTTKKEYETNSPSGKPYSYNQEPDSVIAHDPVEAVCAVEFISRSAQGAGTPFGEVDAPRLILTLLDVDYELVEGADLVYMDGAEYKIDYVAPPMGLFTVTIYSVYCSSTDEA